MDNPHKKNKFLFDINNFDTPAEQIETPAEEEIDFVPPPPTFSEDEIESAKTIAHSQGLNEGRLQAQGEREEFIAQSLEKISANFSSIFAAETYRERQYEEESLRLALEVISILSPSLNSHLGMESLKQALSDVLKRQSEQSEIRIEVDPESATDIDQYIDNIWPDKDNTPRYKVVANSSLEKGACEINWKDGGMIRTPQKTAEDIKEAIEELLAEQVMSKPLSDLTLEENNAINIEENHDSLEKSDSDTPEPTK